ncbi:MAG: hypothetical protein HYS45_02545 [Parcubacteria group bacterium]|nr:hypothetical protein [Parcubacteria group bacterium]
MKFRILIIILLFAAALAADVPAFAQETNPAAPAAETGKVTNTLYARLQVPLPFVATDCSLTGEEGQPILDAQGRPIPAVCDLSDYIRGVYRLLIGLAALFAVVMIIIGGYQWIFSGGSSDKTGAAKKRIFGAAVGLMLALLSYIILNTITPRLVALRLPDVTPVRTIGFSNQDNCNDENNLAVKQFCKDTSSCLADKSASFPKFTRGLDDARCGSRYLVSSDLKTTSGECGGDVCVDASGNRINAACIAGKCIDALMYGTITWSPDNGYVDYLWLYPICNDDDDPGELVADFDVPEKTRLYRLPSLFSVNSALESKPRYEVFGALCRNGLKGYALKVEVNNDCYSIPVDDNDFAVGRSCNSPITSGEAGDLEYDFDDIDWRMVDKEVLFQLEDFENKAHLCNLNIVRANFPVPYQFGTADTFLEASCPTR